MNSEKSINIPERVFEKLVEEDKQLQEVLVKALIRALERDNVKFVVNISVPQLVYTLLHVNKELLAPIIERSIVKALQSVKQ